MKLTSSYSRVAKHLTPRDLGDFPEQIWEMLYSIFDHKPRLFLRSPEQFELSMPVLVHHLSPDPWSDSDFASEEEDYILPDVNPAYEPREGSFKASLHVKFILDPKSKGGAFDERKIRKVCYVTGNADSENSMANVFVNLYSEAVAHRVANGIVPLTHIKEWFLSTVVQVADHEIAHLARQKATSKITEEGSFIPTGWTTKTSEKNYEEYLASPHELDANFHSLVRIYHQLAKTHIPTIDELLGYYTPAKRKFYGQHPDIRKWFIKRFFRAGLPLANKK